MDEEVWNWGGDEDDGNEFESREVCRVLRYTQCSVTYYVVMLMKYVKSLGWGVVCVTGIDVVCDSHLDSIFVRLEIRVRKVSSRREF